MNPPKQMTSEELKVYACMMNDYDKYKPYVIDDIYYEQHILLVDGYRSEYVNASIFDVKQKEK